MRGLDPGNEYMVAGDSETIEDTARKHLYIEQEYTLSVMQPKAGPEKLPLRVITFHRDDMLPYDQDIYDSEGNLESRFAIATTRNSAPSSIPQRSPSSSRRRESNWCSPWTTCRRMSLSRTTSSR